MLYPTCNAPSLLLTSSRDQNGHRRIVSAHLDRSEQDRSLRMRTLGLFPILEDQSEYSNGGSPVNAMKESPAGFHARRQFQPLAILTRADSRGPPREWPQGFEPGARVEGGKLMERWVVSDLHGLIEQIQGASAPGG